MKLSDTVLARTSMASARAGSLLTFSRQVRGHRTTLVTVTACPDGSAEITLERGSPALLQLMARPLAVLTVAPPWCEPLTLHGGVRKLPSDDGDRHVRLHLSGAVVRLGRPCRTIDPEEYAAAAPDPLHPDVPAVLAHLNAGHTDALAACLRAQGRDAAFVEAAALDTHGLTVLSVGAAGVERVRLTFPRPVERLSQLPGGIAGLLRARCARDCEHDPGRRARGEQP